MRVALSRLSARERVLLHLAVLVLAIAVWYSLLLGPMIERWKEVRVEVTSKALLYQKYMRMAQRESVTREGYQHFVDQLRMTGSEEEEMALLLKEIEGLARDKIRITNIKPHSTKDFEFYRGFNVEIDCEGGIGSLVRFIYEAERSRSMFRVRRLRIQAKGGQPGLLEVSLLLSKLSML